MKLPRYLLKFSIFTSQWVGIPCLDHKFCQVRGFIINKIILVKHSPITIRFCFLDNDKKQRNLIAKKKTFYRVSTVLLLHFRVTEFHLNAHIEQIINYYLGVENINKPQKTCLLWTSLSLSNIRSKTLFSKKIQTRKQKTTKKT